MVSISFIYRIRKSTDYKNVTHVNDVNDVNDTNITMNEICSKAEGGCGNRDNEWCCGCKRNEDGRLYQPEVSPKAEDGYQCDNETSEDDTSDDENDSNNGFTDSKVYYGKFTTNYISDDSDFIKYEILPKLLESLNNYNKQNNLELIKKGDIKIGIISIETSFYFCYSSKRELGCFDFYYLGCGNNGTSYVNGHKIKN